MYLRLILLSTAASSQETLNVTFRTDQAHGVDGANPR
jgi:hypothetical protein